MRALFCCQSFSLGILLVSAILLGLLIGLVPQAFAVDERYEALQARHLRMMNRDPGAQNSKAWLQLASEFSGYAKTRGSRANKALLDSADIYRRVWERERSAKFLRSASEHFRKLYDDFSADPLADDALLRHAKLLWRAGKEKQAEKLLSRITKEYAESDSAVEARQILGEVDSDSSRSDDLTRGDKALPIVMLDAGHGGEDFGAVGQGELYEKDINLKFALRLFEKLGGSRFVVPVLTRDTDLFLTLEQRVQLAVEKGASLFVSLHSNSSINPKSRGVEVYRLGEVNQANEEVTSRMNRFSGDGHGSMGDLGAILNEFFDEQKLLEANRMASLFNQGLGTVRKRFPGFKYSGVRTADFYILKHAPIPSVILETLYISNARDRKLLLSREFQESYTDALALAIESYFRSAS